MTYLEKLKKKTNAPDNLIMTMEQVIIRLLEFGYITRRQVKKLEKKLYINIDTILVGDQVILDYKTGYYDAMKKEMYIKDTKNIESIFLRTIYALTTTEISKNNFQVGYSTAQLAKTNYKIIHENFGINRAVVSNLVCRILYSLPSVLTIVPTYRSYENDFIGNKIVSDNDIYFLEGKLLSQMCFSLNTGEEELYINLFSSPKKFLEKFFEKAKLDNKENLTNTFDIISRKYSNYNKLVYLNRILNDNYISIKKNILLEEVNDYVSQQTKIKLAIRNTLSRLDNSEQVQEIPKDTDAAIEEDLNLDASLSERINNFEEEIVELISKLQHILVTTLISSNQKYSNISYAIKLKELSKMLIVDDTKLQEEIFKVVSAKLLNTSEITASNLIGKVKYSIVNEVLSSDKFIKIYKNMTFRKLECPSITDDTAVCALFVDNSFLQLLIVSKLDNRLNEINNNTKSVVLDNLGYLLNNPTAIKDIQNIEKLFTSIKNTYPDIPNLKIENMFHFRVNDNSFVAITNSDTFNIVNIIQKDNTIKTNLIELSEDFGVFDLNDTTLPMIYNKKDNIVTRLLSFLAFIP